MARQNKAQKETVGRVMHEFKHGELKTSHGRRVRNPKQAIAIGLSEAGASNQQSAGQKRRSLARTKRRERQGRTSGESRGMQTRAELYEEARRRDIPGRSRMSKAELEKALRHH